MNPWWVSKETGARLPMRRRVFKQVLNSLCSGLAPAVVLRGPRASGKTTLVSQVADALLSGGVPAANIFRVQFDDIADLKKLSMPIVELCDWYAQNVLGGPLRVVTHRDNPVYILLDCVQNVADWAPQLKTLVDLSAIRVLVTATSGPHLERELDSLAGRITTTEVGMLLLGEIAELHGFECCEAMLPAHGVSDLGEVDFWKSLRVQGERLSQSRPRAFREFLLRGAHIGAHTQKHKRRAQLPSYLRNSLKRALRQDLRMGAGGQKLDDSLLRATFAFACYHAGKPPGDLPPRKNLPSELHSKISPEQAVELLEALEGADFLRLVKPLTPQQNRSLPLICVCDHVLRDAWLHDAGAIGMRISDELAASYRSNFGWPLVESVAGYFLSSIRGLSVAHLLERDSGPAVDYVLTIGQKLIPVAVKYTRTINDDDAQGLRSFLQDSHYHAPFGILVTQGEDPASDDPRIISLPLSTLLLLR